MVESEIMEHFRCQVRAVHGTSYETRSTVSHCWKSILLTSHETVIM